MKHLNASGHHRSGHVRYYFRPKGKKGVPLPDADPADAEFLEAYAALLKDHDGTKPHPRVIHRTGTIGAGIRAYLASDAFLSLAASSRDVWRRNLESIESSYGKGVFDDLRPRHIRTDLSKFGAHSANTRRKVWRSLCRWSLDAGLLEDDPAVQVRSRRTPATDGHAPWTRADVKAFRAFWPHEAPQRLAFELMHRTCASIGDACRLGPGMVKNGWLSYRRRKSKSFAEVPFSVAGPVWFEADHHLKECLRHAPKHMTFIVKAHGAPRSSKAAAQWFSAACRKAGIVGKTAHGIRKHRASVFRENGATKDQRMAILGHETESEADRYAKSANLRLVITGTESSNSPEQSSKSNLK